MVLDLLAGDALLVHEDEASVREEVGVPKDLVRFLDALALYEDRGELLRGFLS